MNDSMRTLLIAGVVGSALVIPASARGDKQRVARQLAESRRRYADADAWSARRKQLREAFLKGARLWPLPKKSPLNVVRHSLRRYDGYTVENVALETLPGFFCTGNLYRPASRRGSTPAILCPHGHFRPLGRFRPNQQIRCAHFARMGATVFSYGMVGWNDSRQTTHADPLVLALQTWNSIRVVDFLAGLDGVDPKRIGITGASGGGTQAFFLAALDDRIRVAAPLVIVYPWAAPQGCRCEGGLPVMQAAQTNAIELAASIAPRPQLLISVGNDPTEKFPQFGFPFIKHVYALHQRESAVRNLHLANEKHDFGKSKRDAVYAFFAEHLKLKLLPERSKSIAIERPDRLEVFNKQHPLPGHAVQGSAAVAKAFAKLRSE